MKMNISYTESARQDLHDIYEYMAFTLLAPDAARNIYSLLVKSARSLQSTPERNPLYCDEPMRSKGIRFMPVKNYLLFYTVNKEKAHC